MRKYRKVSSSSVAIAKSPTPNKGGQTPSKIAATVGTPQALDEPTFANGEARAATALTKVSNGTNKTRRKSSLISHEARLVSFDTVMTPCGSVIALGEAKMANLAQDKDAQSVPALKLFPSFQKKNPHPLTKKQTHAKSSHPKMAKNRQLNTSLILILQQAQTHRHKILDLRNLHAHTIASGLVADTFAASRIVRFFLHHNLRYATRIFDSLRSPDVYTWNLMISSHIESGSPETSIVFYFRMRARPAPPNAYSFALLVKACNEIGSGRLVHAQVIKCGAEDFIVINNSLLRMYCKFGVLDDAHLLFERSSCLDSVSWNTLMSAYGKNGDVEIARKMFDRMPKRNLVSWSALIDGYVREGDFSEALRVWDRFQEEGMEPDEVVLVSVLKACAHLGALDQGRAIHRYVDRSGRRRDGNVNVVVLETALVDMYCKCGCVGEAIEVFDRVENRDVVLWNAMIGGLAMHGDNRHALELFRRMKEKQPMVVPNRSTYIAVLCACTHAGMVDEGMEIFESMKRYGVEPQRDHYGCLADLIGRAGRVMEAEEVLLTMPMKPQAEQWGALMSACRTHKAVEVGERVGRQLIAMDPFDGGRYALLANLYADAGQWENAEEIRREMEQIGAKKETGHSLIEQKVDESTQ